MNIEFKTIKDTAPPDAPSKHDKAILIDGETAGEVIWGWLRNGGMQWTTNLNSPNTYGAKTLKELKRAIARKTKMVQHNVK